MEKEKAIRMFNISNILEESDKTLKKRYKKLMLKYHPDNCNGDDSKAKELNLAYDILKGIVKDSRLLEWESRQKLEKENMKKVLIIKISDLINIYSGKPITIDGIEINSKNVRKYNIMIDYNVILTHNQSSVEFKASKPWNNEDSYKVYCYINVDEQRLDEKEEVKIEIPLCDIEKTINFSSQSINFGISLPYNIRIQVVIEKKIRAKNKE